MERLTKWSEETEGAELKDYDSDEWKELFSYWDFVDECMFKMAIDKLAEYEDLEEQGLLLRLPCKVGDEFFVIAYIDNKITHVRCSGYEISVDDISKKANFSIIWIDSVEKPRDYWRLTFEEFKNRCFATQEEAEQALERMEKENGNVD